MRRGAWMREMFAAGRIVAALGVYDALTARLVARGGLPAIYVTGYGAAASMLGVPDIGLLSFGEILDHVRRVCQAAAGAPGENLGCAVIADADTGYGGPVNVWRTVRLYESAGVDMIQLEDQEWPKRCGHMAGKRLVPAAEMVQRIRAAVAARTDRDTLVLARTDAIAVEGFEAAIARAKAYREAGADVLFVEAPGEEEQLAAVPGLLGAPCLANMVEGGKTPYLSAARLEEMGFAVAIYPITLLLGAAGMAQRTIAAFKREGQAGAARGELLSFGDFNELIGLRHYQALENT